MIRIPLRFLAIAVAIMLSAVLLGAQTSSGADDLAKASQNSHGKARVLSSRR
jgi:hypothetical protein